MGEMEFQQKKERQSYFVQVITRVIRVSSQRVFHSGTYRFAKQSFDFSRRFTTTRVINKGLSQQGKFGMVLKVLFIPLVILLDMIILILGLSIGSTLITIIMIFLMLFIFFSIIKTFFKR